MLEDKYGFLWFGTADGLNKYDGKHFTVYHHDFDDSASIASSEIRCMAEGVDGTLWIGTVEGGVDKFDRATESFIHYRNPRRDVGNTKSICVDRTGAVWFVVQHPQFALYRLNPTTGNYTQYRHDPADPHSISSNYVLTVCLDSSGTVWVGTLDAGINRFDPAKNRFVNYRTVPEYGFAHTDAIYFLAATSGNTLWMGNLQQESIRRLHERNGEVSVTAFRNQMQSENFPGAVFVDATGYVWVGTIVRGIYVLDQRTNKSERYTHNPADIRSLIGNRVAAIHKDRRGNIWVCTDAGVGKIHDRARHFENVLHNGVNPIGLSAKTVRSFLQDSENSLWVGTEGGGLAHRQSDTFCYYRADEPYRDNWQDNTVNALYRTRRGEFLLGTNAGMYTLDKKKGVLKKIFHLLGRNIWTLHEDGRENLWVGTLFNGLLMLDSSRQHIKSFFQLTTIDNAKGEGIFFLHETPDGLFWIGGRSGLYQFNPVTHQIKRYKHHADNPHGLNYNHVWFIDSLNANELILGTTGGGINVFDMHTEQFRHYTTRDGLPSNIICGMLRDVHDNWWISTKRGLAKMSSDRKSIITFGVNDGIAIDNFHFRTCLTDAEGFMYFGGTGGYIRFHPDSIALTSLPPPLVFTSFKVFDKRYPLDSALVEKKYIRLPYNHNFFSLEFAALDMTNPSRNQYQYKLEGLDAAWRQADGSYAVTSYTDVAPGLYRFLLRGANSYGVWNTQGIELFIEVEPAWWQTWWFRAIVGIAVVGILLGFLQWRTAESKRKNSMKKQMAEFQLQAVRAQMNPHFIFNALNSILSFIVANNRKQAHLYLAKFARLIRATLDNSRKERITLAEEVWLLQLYCELEAMRFSGKFAFSITVDPALDADAQHVPAMLLQPFVENAIKHGLIHTRAEGKVEIAFCRDGKWLVCTITDNGIGRHRAQQLKERSLRSHVSQGIGLIRSRLAILEALEGDSYSLDIHDLTSPSAEYGGTRIEVRLPLASKEIPV